MDSLTQIALGSAVGYAVGGKVLGRKALLWGAVLGTAPDLDSFYPFTDAVIAFTWHRGYSHSLVVLSAITPIVALLLTRLHQVEPIQRRRCLLMVWLCLITHPLLDAFTIYGTQLLLPISDYPFGIGSIFIIDPIYTLPLLFGVLAVAVRGSDLALRARINVLGLALSSVYLLSTVITQHSLYKEADEALAIGQINASQVLVQPTPFNTVLWRVLARVEGGYYEGYRSVFDKQALSQMQFYPSDDESISALVSHPAGQRLAWFSKGLFRIHSVDSALVFSDLRMGLEPFYIFNFRLFRDADGEPEVEQIRLQRELPGAFALLAARALDSTVQINASAFAALGVDDCEDTPTSPC